MYSSTPSLMQSSDLEFFFHFFLHNPGSLPSAFIVIQTYLPDVLRTI